MAYFNGFPATYTPLAPVQVPQQQPYTPVQNGRIWVQGEAGARSYLVAPNSTVELWDSEEQAIYLKSADASGMPSIKILDYTIRDSSKNGQNSPVPVPAVNMSDYATKDEIKAVYDKIAAIKERVDNLVKKGEKADE